MSVITAVKLDDFIPACKPTREPNGGHSCFGPGVAHADLVHARNTGPNERGHFDLERVRNAKTGSSIGGFFDGVNDWLKGVAVNSRSPGTDVIDIDVPINVEDTGPFC